MVLLLHQVLRASSGAKLVRSTSSRVEVSLVPEEPETPKAKNQKPKQFVRNDALVKEEEPEDTHRRSEFNNKVERETRAPTGRPSAARAAARASKPSPQSSAASGQPGAKAMGSQAQASPQLPATPQNSGPKLRLDQLGRLAAKTPTQASKVPRLNRPPVQRGAEGSGQSPGRRLRLSDRERMAQMFSRPGTMQDLRDVEEGSKTILNTKRSRYASFFNRVRDAIARHWHPDVLHSAHDPYGKIYGTKDRTTKVIIVLRPDGSVLRVRTTGACGVDYLDEEAVRAIWAAQPFANPPRDLVDPQTQRIEFGFAFTLEFGGRSRIFRMRK